MNEDHERYEPCTADCVLRVFLLLLCFVTAGLVFSVVVVLRDVMLRGLLLDGMAGSVYADNPTSC
jgi:hypothetical protein